MTINSRTKGQTGEREIATALNEIMQKQLVLHGLNHMLEDTNLLVQRNQNQSAVGGFDLINTMHFAIEIKRQETLNINQWWTQAVNQAGSSKTPVLIFRQNRRPWRVMTLGLIHDTPIKAPAEFSLDSFLLAYTHVVIRHIKSNYLTDASLHKN